MRASPRCGGVRVVDRNHHRREQIESGRAAAAAEHAQRHALAVVGVAPDHAVGHARRDLLARAAEVERVAAPADRRRVEHVGHRSLGRGGERGPRRVQRAGRGPVQISFEPPTASPGWPDTVTSWNAPLERAELAVERRDAPAQQAAQIAVAAADR